MKSKSLLLLLSTALMASSSNLFAMKRKRGSEGEISQPRKKHKNSREQILGEILIDIENLSGFVEFAEDFQEVIIEAENLVQKLNKYKGDFSDQNKLQKAAQALVKTADATLLKNVKDKKEEKAVVYELLQQILVKVCSQIMVMAVGMNEIVSAKKYKQDLLEMSQIERSDAELARKISEEESEFRQKQIEDDAHLAKSLVEKEVSAARMLLEKSDEKDIESCIIA